jgi:cytochrome oxidase Cu insertion factor (SCO1/SenC/PrrC family)
LLAILFLGPLAAAWIMYFEPGGWRPTGAVNHGILVDPPVTLPVVRVADSGPDGSDGDLHGRWTMLYLDGGECADRCRQALDISARTRLALGRRMVRVQRVYIAEGPLPEIDLSESQADLMVTDGSREDLRALLSALPAELPRDGSEILLVDPLGNLMMRFPLDQDPKGMLEDIKKLLRLSRIG